MFFICSTFWLSWKEHFPVILDFFLFYEYDLKLITSWNWLFFILLPNRDRSITSFWLLWREYFPVNTLAFFVSCKQDYKLNAFLCANFIWFSLWVSKRTKLKTEKLAFSFNSFLVDENKTVLFRLTNGMRLSGIF